MSVRRERKEEKKTFRLRGGKKDLVFADEVSLSLCALGRWLWGILSARLLFPLMPASGSHSPSPSLLAVLPSFRQSKAHKVPAPFTTPLPSSFLYVSQSETPPSPSSSFLLGMPSLISALFVLLLLLTQNAKTTGLVHIHNRYRHCHAPLESGFVLRLLYS